MIKLIQKLVNSLYTCRFKDFDTNPIYAVRDGRRLYLTMGMSRRDFYMTQIKGDFSDKDWVFRLCGVFEVTVNGVIFKYYIQGIEHKIDMADLSASEYGRLMSYLSLLAQIVGVSCVDDWHHDFEVGDL